MDLFFHQKSVTEVSLYNCSAISEEKLVGLRAMRRPIRGASTMVFGVGMMLIYIACLRVMVKLDLVRKACYKIMFLLGIFEIVNLFINDVFNGCTFSIKFVPSLRFLLTVNSFFVSSSYTLFLFTGNRLVILQTCYVVYQISLGLQAFVYLLFNKTILEGVKDDLCALLDIKREKADELRTAYKTTTTQITQPKLNVITLL